MSLVKVSKNGKIKEIPEGSFKQFSIAGWSKVEEKVEPKVEPIHDEWDEIEEHIDQPALEKSIDDVDKMNAGELKKYATELGIDIGKYSRVGELRKAIKSKISQKDE